MVGSYHSKSQNCERNKVGLMEYLGIYLESIVIIIIINIWVSMDLG
jgi:hypothetical protein